MSRWRRGPTARSTAASRCARRAHIIGLILLLSVLPARAARAPELIEGVRQVNAEGLIELAVNRPGLVVIDARMQGDRRHGYIEGSVSLPDIDTDCGTLAATVRTLETPTVFYCNGVSCMRSARAVTRARECGYRELFWFRGGFEEWITKGYPYLRE